MSNETPADERAKSIAFLEDGAVWADEACVVWLAVIRELERELLAARARIGELREALREFGEHKSNCARRPHYMIDCNCGLGAMLAASDKAREALAATRGGDT